MKQVTFAILATILSTICFSQSKDSVYVIKDYDEMSNKTYIYPNRGVVVSNEEKSVGFKISAFISEGLVLEMLTVKIVGIGSCHENDEIIILFEDGQKITKKSWNKFNCKGDSYFNISDKEVSLLATKKITKIRISNGYSFESYTGDIQEKDKSYFIKILSDLETKTIVNKK